MPNKISIAFRVATFPAPGFAMEHGVPPLRLEGDARFLFVEMLDRCMR